VTDQTLTEYASGLAPPIYDRAEASIRRKAVETALAASSLRVTSMFESGSWTHGTSISAKSDVDYMAVATGPQANGYRVYWIGGRKDEWVLSAPGAHLAYVNRQNDRLGKKVKPLVRLLKAWKHNVGAPVSSFYLEIRTAEYAAGESVIIYDIDLRRVMNAIVAADARDMNDPARIVGRIPACASWEKRHRTLALLKTAVSDLNADAARTVGDRHGYWRAMVKVFGSGYPWPAW
jgi:hypothetical protein